jgi:hypothetical protein
LRQLLWERINSGQITGLKLAHQAGFQQAHISNFLNRKRSLSQEGMDRVLAIQNLSVLDLLDPGEINKRASIPAPSESGYQNVVLVDSETAATEPLITRDKVRDILKFRRGLLRRLRPDARPLHPSWTRFVLVRLGPEAMCMYPRILPGAVALIDRHYNSLRPYRKGHLGIFAVRKDNQCAIKYVERANNNLILRPHNQGHPVDLIPVDEGRDYREFIVGRVCHLAVEC